MDMMTKPNWTTQTDSLATTMHWNKLQGYLIVFLIMTFHLQLVFSQVGPPLEYAVLEEQSAGEFVGNVKADAGYDDLSEGDLDQLQFKFRYNDISPYNIFKIDERMGIIQTREKIDREEVCAYRLTCELELDITVRPIEFFRIIKVVIKVSDINDHKPSFPQSQMSMTLSETTMPGATFPIPIADDADMGQYGIQRYELQTAARRNPFQLKITNHSDGSMDVKMKLIDRLDRENDQAYKLIVTAFDGGMPSKTGTIVIDIVITDANDNNPRFDNVSYHATVEENLPINSIIMTVHATDPDEGANGEIVYSFSTHTVSEYGNVFGINNQTGEIYVKGSIDYEQESIYQLTVTAADKGPNSLPAFTKVTVEVLDVNDHSPEINVNTLTNHAYAQVLENAEVGTFVAHISVVDADSGDSGQFSCEIDNSLFELAKLYGTEFQLKSATVFDRETKEEYQVQMTCHDKGQPPQSSSKHINIRVKDENDHSPVFPKEHYLVNLNENNTVNQLIVSIRATDADIDRNKAIRYELQALRDKDANTLRIDPITGEIRADIVFDYEKQKFYDYVIVASDHGQPSRSASAFLNLTIVDINDEPPLFPQMAYIFSVPEGEMPNVEVGEVTATDKDLSPAFNDIVYYLDQDMTTSSSFEIATKTGKLFSTKTLDREKHAFHYLTVVASNEGYPNVKSRVNVTIEVLDKNDNPPVIDFPTHANNTVEISNRVPLGHVVTRIRSHDLDAEINGHLTYSIANGNSENYFDIDPITGAISVEKSLQSIEHKLFTLVIRVRDNGSPEKNTITDLNIKINKSLAYAVAQSGPLLEGSNFMILIGAVAGALFLLVMIILAVLILRHKRRQDNKRHKYNCRIQEANKTVANGVVSNGEVEKEHPDDVKSHEMDTSEPSKGTLKKEVTFNFDMSDDSYMDKIAPSWTSLQDDPDIQIKHPPEVRRSSPEPREPPPKPERSLDTQVTSGGPGNTGPGSTAPGSSSTLPRLTPRGIPKPPMSYHDRRKHMLQHPGDRHFPPRGSPHHQPPPPHQGTQGGGGGGAISYHPSTGAPTDHRQQQQQHNPRLTQVDLEMHDMLNLSQHTDRDSESGCSGSYTDSGRGPSEEGDNYTFNPHLDSYYPGESRKTYTEIFTTDASGHNDSTSSQGSGPKSSTTPVAVNHPGPALHHARGRSLPGGGSGKPQELDVMQLTQIPPTRRESPAGVDHGQSQGSHFSTFRGGSNGHPLATSSQTPSPVNHPPPPPPRSEYSSRLSPSYNNDLGNGGGGYHSNNNLNSNYSNGGANAQHYGTIGGGNLKWTSGAGGDGCGTLGTSRSKKEVRFAEDCNGSRRDDDVGTDYTSSMDGLSDDGTTTSGSYIMESGEVRGISLEQPKEVSV